jgi:ferredoxin
MSDDVPAAVERLSLGGAINAVVDLSVCIGSGMCTSIAPDVFDLDRHGTLVLLTTEVGPEDAGGVRDAADCCPVEAISVSA